MKIVVKQNSMKYLWNIKQPIQCKQKCKSKKKKCNLFLMFMKEFTNKVNYILLFVMQVDPDLHDA